MGKKTREAGTCEFCGALGVTQEHVWPKSVREYFSDRVQRHLNARIDVQPSSCGSYTAIRPDPILVRGDVITKTVRKVCEVCNGGWMRLLDESITPQLFSMIKGENTKLDESDLNRLAKWCIKVSMVCELLDATTSASRFEDRKQLRDHFMIRTPLSIKWAVWLGKSDDQAWKRRYKHCAFAIRPNASLEPVVCDSQATTIGLGKLFMHAFSTQTDSIAGPPAKPATHGMKLILPFTPEYLNTSDLAILSSKACEEISKGI